MFKRILVAIDKSPVSQTAYRKAIALAKLFNAKLIVFHMLHEHESGSPEIPVTANLPYVTELNDVLRDNYRQAWQTFQKEYANYLNWLAEEAKQAGVDAEFAQEIGDPGRGICDFAREWHADLVVTGSQGRTGLSELFLGSVSNHITHHAPCSVLVVHQGDRSSEDDLVLGLERSADGQSETDADGSADRDQGAAQQASAQGNAQGNAHNAVALSS